MNNSIKPKGVKGIINKIISKRHTIKRESSIGSRVVIGNGSGARRKGMGKAGKGNSVWKFIHD